MSTWSDPTQMKILPMKELAVSFAFGPDISFPDLEEDSSWSLAEIEEPDDVGGIRLVGWEWLVTAIVPQNVYDLMQSDLVALARRRDVTFVSLTLKPLDGQANGDEMRIEMDDPTIRVRSFYFRVRFDSASMRPRVRIEMGGIFSAELLEINGSYGPFFTRL